MRKNFSETGNFGASCFLTAMQCRMTMGLSQHTSALQVAATQGFSSVSAAWASC